MVPGTTRTIWEALEGHKAVTEVMFFQGSADYWITFGIHTSDSAE